MMSAAHTYERPLLERYGTFRELTQVSLNLGAFALNTNVLNGSAASCDCVPGEAPPGGGSRS
ncbi:MAG: lasso RiPP family leader peptide-containing protein [Gemmatimonadaceae bacterium]|nr:lasso RiPP family leader peptide-containing protein [Gemmatimonadaceae bacterium]